MPKDWLTELPVLTINILLLGSYCWLGTKPKTCLDELGLASHTTKACSILRGQTISKLQASLFQFRFQRHPGVLLF